MKTQSRWVKLALTMALLSLLATACRGADDDGAADDGDDTVVTTDDADDAEPDDADDADDADAADDAEPTDDADAEPTDEADDAEPTDDADAEPAGDVTFDVGVTEEACPDAVNADNGCIYLGTISDLTVGPFAPLAVPITEAQVAFWDRVNQDGGINGFDINVAEFTRDNQYSPEVHSQQYEEIKNEVLALAQTLGSPTTFAILDDLEANNIVSAPASWTSAWLFSDAIVESGNTYCIETMNGLDWLVEEGNEVTTVMAVHYPGDYGDDGAAGAARWTEANEGTEFINVPTVPGADNQGEAIGAIVSQSPDVVVLTVAPTEAGTIVGQSAAQGFTGRFLFNSPAFNPGLLQSPAAPAVTGLVTVAGPWQSYDTDTPGHQAMRDALGDITGNDGYTSGWAWSYPLLAVLQQAADNGDLTRDGMAAALSEVTEVDYEGMLPEGSGNLSGEADASAVRATAIGTPSGEVDSGLVSEPDFYTGPTAEAYVFEAPCYEEGL